MSAVYYDASQQWVLNGTLALMVLGLALDIKPKSFVQVFQQPKGPMVALGAQFLLLPFFTFLLTLLLDLPVGIELGMILVAACPGGALSNFITHLCGGNTALSISITAMASAMAIFLLPINFLFWASLNPETNAMLQSIDVNGKAIVSALITVLAVPLIMGFLIKHYLPVFSGYLHKVLKYLSFVALFIFISVAVYKNQVALLELFWLLLLVVFLHNALALMLGYTAAAVSRLDMADKKAITLEVGMQNSSLAIAIVFAQFDGQYGMALISAFWGIWHIVSGLAFAGFSIRFLSSRVLSS